MSGPYPSILLLQGKIHKSMQRCKNMNAYYKIITNLNNGLSKHSSVGSGKILCVCNKGHYEKVKQ